MFVKTLEEVIGTEDHAKGEAFESRRLLLARDDLGYSFHDTLVKAGTVQLLEYKDHIETNYCIEGKGEVENETTGEVWPLEPGVMYVLDQNDPHIVRAETNLRFICIFTPALTGREDQNKAEAAPDPA